MLNKRKDILNVYRKIKSYAATGRVFNLSRQRIHQIVSNYHNFGRHNRKDKYKKIPEKCVICKKLPPKLLHHKDFNNANDDVKNLQPVCPSCHSLLHNNHRDEIEYYRGKFSSCRECGTKFSHGNYARGHGLCSKCYGYERIKKQPRIRNCEACGQEFNSLNEGGNHYCQYCHEVFLQQKNAKKITKCNFCGLYFHPYRGGHKGKNLYCGVKCYFKSKNITS